MENNIEITVPITCKVKVKKLKKGFSIEIPAINAHTYTKEESKVPEIVKTMMQSNMNYLDMKASGAFLEEIKPNEEEE